jgi:acyl dehydratase
MGVEYFEDYAVGAEYLTHARTITETEIVTFVNLVGFFEPLFIDMEFVKNQSLFGGRIGPGTLTFALSEGLMAQSGLIRGGMALLGVDGMRLHAPLRCGDTIRVKITVLTKREASKPDRGIVTCSHEVMDQHGERLMEYTVTRMIRRRTDS